MIRLFSKYFKISTLLLVTIVMTLISCSSNNTIVMSCISCSSNNRDSYEGAYKYLVNKASNSTNWNSKTSSYVYVLDSSTASGRTYKTYLDYSSNNHILSAHSDTYISSSNEKCEVSFTITSNKPSSAFFGNIKYTYSYIQAGTFNLPLSYKAGNKIDVNVTISYDSVTKSFLEAWVRSSIDTLTAGLSITLIANHMSMASLGFTNY